MQCPREGYTGVRKRMLEHAAGKTLVSLNDDVEPAPEFLTVHLRQQRAAEGAGRPAIVVGDSPWKIHPGDTLFDRLVRETPIVFFYGSMHAKGPSPEHDWGFRHCFGLNFSAPMTAVREVGGFRFFPFTYGYDDIELGFKLQARFGMPVRFCPGAIAPHDHRYGPPDMLRREYSLGRAAWLFAGANPEFGRALFGRDIREPAELAYSREFLARERGSAAMIQTECLRLGEVPSGVVSGQHAPRVLAALAQQFTLLKRYVWRQGLLDEAAGEAGGYRPLEAS
jgi:GT2 family glycosyltransferase